MPKTPRQRDYAAEYRRRVELERERATREGRPFSLSRARGHGRIREALPRSPLTRNVKARVRNLYNANKKALGGRYPDWEDVEGAAENYSWSDVELVLRQQADSIADYKRGNPHTGRVAYRANTSGVYPIEFFWYHGN